MTQVYKMYSPTPEHCSGSKAALLSWYVRLFLWRMLWQGEENLLPTLISLTGINFAGKIFLRNGLISCSISIRFDITSIKAENPIQTFLLHSFRLKY